MALLNGYLPLKTSILTYAYNLSSAWYDDLKTILSFRVNRTKDKVEWNICAGRNVGTVDIEMVELFYV